MFTIRRKKTRKIRVGDKEIGGDTPISVQSMTNTDTANVDATVAQIKSLEDAGCEIVRVAVPDEKAADALADIKKRISIPIIADIHFRYDFALKAMNAGVDGVRINPGNIGSHENVVKVVEAAKKRNIPIRIGVNSGSIEKHILEKFSHPCPEALVASALDHVRILENLNFHDIKISVKASSVYDTIQAYRILSDKVDYPLHLGVTEAGTLLEGAIKSAMGIGTLLQEGIGDTIRVSLTADVVYEVRAAFEILSNLGLRKRPYPEIISCPTCGRAKVNIEKLVGEVKSRLAGVKVPLKIAVMGCIVNGPGEAKEADVGIAGGDGKGAIIRDGKVIRSCNEEKLIDELMIEIEDIIKRKI